MADEKKVPVILLMDVWDENGNRIESSPVEEKDPETGKEIRTKKVMLSLPLAKAMLAADKAIRADPLPGE